MATITKSVPTIHTIDPNRTPSLKISLTHVPTSTKLLLSVSSELKIASAVHRPAEWFRPAMRLQNCQSVAASASNAEHITCCATRFPTVCVDAQTTCLACLNNHVANPPGSTPFCPMSGRRGLRSVEVSCEHNLHKPIVTY